MADKPHVYEYNVDLDSDTAAVRVIQFTREAGAKKVLEIGAGPGSITRHLSGTLGCDVVALEIDPTAIDSLKKYARSIHGHDLNDPTWSEKVRAAEGTFDAVIAADVLEHVYDPARVLAGMKSLLAPGGSIILSLPHAGHVSVIACLLDENFEYRDWGLLDRTHVRFFGIKNIQDLYEGRGLAIESAAFVVRTPEMTEFSRRWSRLPADVRRTLDRAKFGHVYQVVTRAVPDDGARAGLRLVEQDVPPPPPAIVRYWTSAINGLSGQDAGDKTPMIGPGASAGWRGLFSRRSDA